MSNSIGLNRIEIDGQKVLYSFSIPREIRVHANPAYVDSQNNGTLFIELPNGVVAKDIPEGDTDDPFYWNNDRSGNVVSCSNKSALCR